MDNLVGATEIAKKLGLGSPQRVRDWKGRYPDFPVPVAGLAMGDVWNWPEVEAWYKQAVKRNPALGQQRRKPVAG